MNRLTTDIPTWKEDAETKQAAYEKMNTEMHYYTGFSCDNKGLKVNVYEKADNCDGTPTASSLATWGEC